MGAIAGLVLSVYYKDQGPKRKIYSWELEEELEDKDEDKYWEVDVESKNEIKDEN